MITKTLLLAGALLLSCHSTHAAFYAADQRAIVNKDGTMAVEPNEAYALLWQLGWHKDTIIHFLLDLNPAEKLSYIEGAAKKYGPPISPKPNLNNIKILSLDEFLSVVNIRSLKFPSNWLAGIMKNVNHYSKQPGLTSEQRERLDRIREKANDGSYGPSPQNPFLHNAVPTPKPKARLLPEYKQTTRL